MSFQRMGKEAGSDSSAWEVRVLKQLYKKYDHILWAHRVRMRGVALQLMDSTRHWGLWDPERRTIWISRRLVREHSWYCVESILRHEMAHQYCSEVLALSHEGHGATFRIACERLGVPQEFTRASIQFQESSLNWKEERQDPESEKLLSKVEKLLALATSSNEHEAFLAMSKVRELYAKYNLEQIRRREDLWDSTGSPQSFRNADSEMAQVLICHRKKRIEAHQDKIAGILVGHFFVKVVFTKEYDPHTEESFQAIQLIGTRQNVLMAEYVYHFLMQQTESLVVDFRKKRPQLSRVAAKSYRLGILEGFEFKLSQMEAAQLARSQERQEGLAAASAGEGASSWTPQTAVALRQAERELEQYVAQLYPRLASASTSSQRIDQSVYNAGQVQGQRLTLSRPIVDQKGDSGRYLTSRSGG